MTVVGVIRPAVVPFGMDQLELGEGVLAGGGQLTMLQLEPAQIGGGIGGASLAILSALFVAIDWRASFQ